jgi:hypothetical protein
MIVSINQPAYMPWLGYFDRIVKSDVHVVLDHVQFEKNSMVNRNKIRTAQGDTMLTVPLLTKGKFGDLAINALQTDQTQKWEARHLKSLKSSYARAPHAEEHLPFFEELLSTPQPDFLLPVMAITEYLLGAFGIKTPIKRSSEMACGGTKGDLVLNICKELGATQYISGPFGRDYLDMAVFQAEGIEIIFHDYAHPVYKQMHGPFEPYMSAVDLLLNCGADSLGILKN